jgi:hypothetical protein
MATEKLPTDKIYVQLTRRELELLIETYDIKADLEHEGAEVLLGKFDDGIKRLNEPLSPDL